MVSGLTLMSCKKKDNGSPNGGSNVAVNPTPPILLWGNADGVLIGIRNTDYQDTGGGVTATNYGTAIAAFSDGKGGYYSAGKVKAQGASLTMQGDSSYRYIVSGNNPAGINFQTVYDWIVTGSAHVGALNYNQSGGWPGPDNLKFLKDYDSVNVSEDFTIGTNKQTGNTDSIIYIVAGPKGRLMVSKRNDKIVNTFTAADMLNHVGAGKGFVQIITLVQTEQTINGKSYYFINEKVMTQKTVFYF